MTVSRRLLLAALAASPALPAVAQAGDPRMAERSVGPADSKVVVTEWFSLTCSHCADFHKQTFAQVRSKLVEPGRIRFVWRDFPLDQVALTAAMVSRALPEKQYEPFIAALLSSQDRWAFARNVNSTEELAKLAALAGMPRELFNRTIADAGLKQAILLAQTEGEKAGVRSTPTFVINGRVTAGAVGYDAFAKAVEAAA